MLVERVVPKGNLYRSMLAVKPLHQVRDIRKWTTAVASSFLWIANALGLSPFTFWCIHKASGGMRGTYHSDEQLKPRIMNFSHSFLVKGKCFRISEVPPERRHPDRDMLLQVAENGAKWHQWHILNSVCLG